jgi:hypothetical protein
MEGVFDALTEWRHFSDCEQISGQVYPGSIHRLPTEYTTRKTIAMQICAKMSSIAVLDEPPFGD